MKIKTKLIKKSNSLRKFQKIFSLRPIVFLCIGSRIRADDGWTYHLLKDISKITTKDVHYFWGSTAPENFIKPITELNPKCVIICDSADLDKKVGDYDIFGINRISEESFLTHRMSLRQIASEILCRAKCDVFFLLMQPKSLEFRPCVSPLIRKKTKEISDQIVGMIRHTI